MKELLLPSFLALFVLVFVFLVIALVQRPHLKSAEDFFLMSKNLKSRNIFSSTFAQGMSFATVFIAFLQLANEYKGALIWAAVTYAAGWFFFSFFNKKISSISLDKDTGTIHSYLGDRYGNVWLTRIASIATSIGFVGILSTELIVGSEIFSKIGLGDDETMYYYALFFLAACVIAYSSIGGFRAVIKTDSLQAGGIFVSILILIVFAVIIVQKNGAILEEAINDTFDFKPITIRLLLNLLLINTLFPIVDMSAWQRIIASENAKTGKKATIAAAFVFLTTWLIIIVVSIIFSKVFNTTSSDGGIIEILKYINSVFNNYPVVFSSLSFLLFAGFISAMLSTSDSFLISTSHTISMDISKSRGIKWLTIIGKARLQIIVSGIVGVGLSLLLYKLGFKIVDLVFAVYGSTLSLFPVTLFALLYKKDLKHLKKWSVVSVFFGLLFSWINSFLAIMIVDSFFFDTQNSPIIAIIIAALVLSIGVLAKYKNHKL